MLGGFCDLGRLVVLAPICDPVGRLFRLFGAFLSEALCGYDGRRVRIVLGVSAASPAWSASRFACLCSHTWLLLLVVLAPICDPVGRLFRLFGAFLSEALCGYDGRRVRIVLGGFCGLGRRGLRVGLRGLCSHTWLLLLVVLAPICDPVGRLFRALCSHGGLVVREHLVELLLDQPAKPRGHVDGLLLAEPIQAPQHFGVGSEAMMLAA